MALRPLELFPELHDIILTLLFLPNNWFTPLLGAVSAEFSVFILVLLKLIYKPLKYQEPRKLREKSNPYVVLDESLSLCKNGTGSEVAK